MGFFFVIILIAVIIIAAIFFYVSSIIATPPKDRAIDFIESDCLNEGRVIACIGDSLTHGNIGECWVDSLRQEFPNDKFLNEGINGDVVWQVQQRLEPILACKPDVVTLMIGSNDAMASFDEGSGKRYKKNGQLPEIPTLERYKELLPELLERLKTIPKIAICTLPPVGENKASLINIHIENFNEFIKSLALEKNITLLPISDLIWAELNNRTYPIKNDYDPRTLSIIRRIFGGTIQHYIFKIPWDKISKSKGQWILFDQIHLNERGAKVVFNEVKKYIFLD